MMDTRPAGAESDPGVRGPVASFADRFAPASIRHPATVAVLACTLAACAGEGATSHTVVTDSAGVSIVMSTEPVWTDASAWSVANQPDLTIGEPAESDAAEFTRIRRVHSLEDGTIAVVNTGRPTGIRLFDGQGTHIRTIGREGAGPGEFRAIWDAWLARPDTIIVFDPGLSRMTYFNATGDVLRSEQFEQGASNVAWIPWARFADDTFLMRRNVFIENIEGSGPGRSVAPGVRGTPNGEIVDTIGVFPESDYFVRASGTPGVVRYGRRAVLLVSGMSYYRGMGDTFAIDEYDVSGRHVRSMRRSFEPRPITDEMAQRLFEHEVEATPPSRRDVFRQLLTDQPVAETFPAFAESWIVDSGANLWVQHFASALDPQAPWTVFDPDGRWLGDVAFPDGFTPHEIGDDYVLGVMKDEFDVETVRRYALDRGD